MGQTFAHSPQAVHLSISIYRGFWRSVTVKLPICTSDFFDLRQGHQVDVQVPSALDQFGGDDTHGAVVGGKRFVQLGHDATDGRLGLGHVNKIARIRQIQRRLYAGNAATDDQNGADNRFLLVVVLIYHWAFLNRFRLFVVEITLTGRQIRPVRFQLTHARQPCGMPLAPGPSADHGAEQTDGYTETILPAASQ
jgi:hypothetical protein